MSIRTTLALAGVAVVLIACAGDGDGAASQPAPDTPPAPAATNAPAATDVPTTPTATTEPTTTVAVRPASPCERTGTEEMGRVETADLTEASGLVASRAHPGVLWSHNDGGARPGVFAIGADGSDLGFHALPVDAVDIEDMAIAGNGAGGEGVGGHVLYLADIGDNGERRPSISLFRFAEPDPATPGPVESVERFDFTYPDRPHNAETLLVDERNGRIVIVTKEQAAGSDGRPDPLGATEVSHVFEGSLDVSPDGSPTMLTETGVVDTLALEDLASSSLHPSTIFGFGGVVTGGDVAPDGSFVALRTYEAVWVWTRGDDESVAESLSRDVVAGEPCQVVSVSELQGEAIAFDGDELVTLGEGVQQPINRLGR